MGFATEIAEDKTSLRVSHLLDTCIAHIRSKSTSLPSRRNAIQTEMQTDWNYFQLEIHPETIWCSNTRADLCYSHIKCNQISIQQRNTWVIVPIVIVQIKDFSPSYHEGLQQHRETTPTSERRKFVLHGSSWSSSRWVDYDTAGFEMKRSVFLSRSSPVLGVRTQHVTPWVFYCSERSRRQKADRLILRLTISMITVHVASWLVR